MVGLPRSGKSTACRQYRAFGFPVVGRDAVRLALHGQRYNEGLEWMVAGTTRAMVKSLFIAGHQVVVLDECNVTERARREWLSPHWDVAYDIIPTSPFLCRQRALNNEDWEIIPVIDRMAGQWENPEFDRDRGWVEKQAPLPSCGGKLS